VAGSRCLDRLDPVERGLQRAADRRRRRDRHFDRLDKRQQAALLAAGKKAEEYFRKEGSKLDDEMVKAFKDHNVEVVTMTPAEYQQWIDVAKKSSYADFAKEVPDGKKLIDEALAVK
jgi:TRAP-type C4-dicarboxylate transport system substrate-binding protein